jgi:hypothetical protein
MPSNRLWRAAAAILAIVLIAGRGATAQQAPQDGSNRASGKDIRFPDGRKLLLGLSATGSTDQKA